MVSQKILFRKDKLIVRILAIIVTSRLMVMPVVLSTAHNNETVYDVSPYDWPDFYDNKSDKNRLRLGLEPIQR